LNNLPAWLVKKQLEQQQQKEKGKEAETINGNLNPSSLTNRNQFDDASSATSIETKDSATTKQQQQQRGCTVLLTNMVGPGEVDDELTSEVKEECELRCGKVIKVSATVHAIDDSVVVTAGGGGTTTTAQEKEEVRVYVTFERMDAARKAAGVFHGRMFGNRQISSRLL